MVCRNFCIFFKYAWDTRKAQLLFAFSMLVVFAVIVHPWTKSPLTNWWDWMEPITGMVTLAIAGMVWVNGVRFDLDNSLPKRLTVKFFFLGKEVMVCEKAYLSSKGDIRQWGQQLGSQMAGTPILRFEPSIKQTIGQKDYDELTGEQIKLYTVEFSLTELPKPNEVKGQVVNQTEITNFKAGKRIRWYYDNNQGTFLKKWSDDNKPLV